MVPSMVPPRIFLQQPLPLPEAAQGGDGHPAENSFDIGTLEPLHSTAHSWALRCGADLVHLWPKIAGSVTLSRLHRGRQAPVGGLLRCWESWAQPPAATAPSEVESGRIDLKKTKPPLGQSVLTAPHCLKKGEIQRLSNLMRIL